MGQKTLCLKGDCPLNTTHGTLLAKVGVFMDQRKVQCTLKWPILRFDKQLRGYLGPTSYYKCFIKEYGVIAKPLTGLLKPSF